MAILKLSKAHERQEIDFELDYLMSLTIHERFQMMLQKNREIVSLLKRRYGNQKATEVIKRT